MKSRTKEDEAYGDSQNFTKESNINFNQLITVAGITFTLFSTGNITGFSSVSTYQLTRPGASIEADHEDISWIASLATVGMFCGTLIGGVVGDVLGRRKTIMASSLVFFLGWILIFISTDVGHILLGRLLTGAASGVYSTTIQVYICEIVDPSIRGVSGSIPTLMVSIGVIFIYILGSQINWRLLALVSSVFPLFICFYMTFLPDSPIWLISKGRYEKAVASLSWLTNDPEKAEAAVGKLVRISNRRNSVGTNQNPKSSSLSHIFGKPIVVKRKISQFLSRFSERSVLHPLGIGLMLFFFQKFCGVSSINFYATLIFKYADNDINDYVQTIVIGFVRLISTLISIFLIKFYKRRILLITSGLMMFLSNGILGGYFYLKANYSHIILLNTTESDNKILSSVFSHNISSDTFIYSAMHSHSLDCLPLICVTLFMIFSSIGFGVIPFFLVVELLPSDVRSISCSIAYGFCQLCQFLALKTFLNMLDTIDTYGTFWFYSGVAFTGALFVVFFVPETSHLNSAEIEKLFDVKKELGTPEETSGNSSSENEDEESSTNNVKSPLLKRNENNYASIRM